MEMKTPKQQQTTRKKKKKKNGTMGSWTMLAGHFKAIVNCVNHF